MELKDVNENHTLMDGDDKRKKTNHKDLFEEFYSGVTFHGFRFLFQGHWSRKLVWFVITSGVFLFSTYLFNDLLNEYLEHHTKTGSATHFESEMKFPTITFCPLSTLSKKKFDNLPTEDWYMETFKFLEKMENRVDNLIDFYSVYHVSFEDLTETDILKEPFIESACVFYDRACNISMFTKKVWRGWLCFQFNALQDGRKQASVKDAQDYFSGLQVHFDFGGIESNWHLNGMLVIVTGYGDSDDMKPSNRHILLRPGEYSIVKLKEKRQKLLKDPFHTKCIDDKPFNIIDKSHRYTYGLCITDCSLSYINETCGCVAGELNLILKEEIKVCGLRDFYCYHQHQGGFDPDCYNNCMYECSRTTYEISRTGVSISVSDEMYESIKQLEELKGKTIEEVRSYVGKNIIGVQISFFDNFISVESLSESVSWTNLLATIGGAVGLSFGFSFVTGFEFIFFIYDLIKLALSRKTRE